MDSAAFFSEVAIELLFASIFWTPAHSIEIFLLLKIVYKKLEKIPCPNILGE